MTAGLARRVTSRWEMKMRQRASCSDSRHRECGASTLASAAKKRPTSRQREKVEGGDVVSDSHSAQPAGPRTRLAAGMSLGHSITRPIVTMRSLQRCRTCTYSRCISTKYTLHAHAYIHTRTLCVCGAVCRHRSMGRSAALGTGRCEWVCGNDLNDLNDLQLGGEQSKPNLVPADWSTVPAS
jgi:hypothetical protein